LYRLDRGTHRGQPRDTGGAGYWDAEKPDSKSGYVWPFSLPSVILICRYRCRQSGEDLEPMAQYRVIIAGGRHFNNYPMLSNYADKLLERRRAAGDDIVIISGHCYGTDLLGERYARERGYRLEIFEAKWSRIWASGRAKEKCGNGRTRRRFNSYVGRPEQGHKVND